MTICIAAICDLGKGTSQSPGIVFCADRLISGGLKFEHGIPKIKWIPNRAVVLEAGDGSLSDLVVDKQFLKESAKATEVRQIADILMEKINMLKQEMIQQKILAKYSLDYNSYLDNNNKINEILMDKIESEVEKLIYNLELEFIVAGLDSDGTPQLFKVSVEKEVQCYNSIGFVAIGSGTPLSFMEITKFTHRNYVELSEAVLKVYSAKKNSERVESVGSLTDLGFLSLEKEKETDKDFITNLIELPQEFKDFLDIELKAISDSENKIKTSIIEKVRDKLG